MRNNQKYFKIGDLVYINSIFTRNNTNQTGVILNNKIIKNKLNPDGVIVYEIFCLKNKTKTYRLENHIYNI